MMRSDYVVKKVYRSFVVVSILMALTATLGMLIDNVIVGRFLGVEALGAMGVISPISLIFSAFGNICSGGGTVQVAQAIGKGDQERIKSIFTVTMLFVVAAGGIITVIGLIFAPQIAIILGAKGSLHPLATDYLRGIFFGAIPTIMTTALISFVKIDGSPRLPLISIGVMSVANIILDLAMIFIFDLGMFGMALATSIAYCLAVLTACTHFKKKYCRLKLVKPKDVVKEIGVMIGTGAPTAIGRICDTIKVMTLNNLLVGVAGAGAVAALNVRTQVNNIVGAIIMGVGSAIVPIAGMFYGEEDRTSLRAALKDTFRVGLVLSGVAALLLFLFPSGFASALGVSEPEILAMAKLAVRCFAVGMPLQLMNLVMMNFYQSTRNTVFATMICLMQSLIFTTGFSLLLTPVLGAKGVWYAFFLGEVCTLLFVLVYITIRKRKLPHTFSDIMSLPDDFGVDVKEKLEISLGNSMEEVMTVSQGIYSFCQERQIDSQLANKISLFIEEMAGNVVQHVFHPGEKKWFDFVIINKEERLLIHLRDNGAAFDPLTYMSEHKDDKEHLGIRLVMGLADNVEYRRSMGLNNLIISVQKGKMGI